MMQRPLMCDESCAGVSPHTHCCCDCGADAEPFGILGTDDIDCAYLFALYE